MTRSLVRACLTRGCSNVVRGRPYCHACQRTRDKVKTTRRSARILRTMLAIDPSPAERPITHRDDPGPVVA